MRLGQPRRAAGKHVLHRHHKTRPPRCRHVLRQGSKQSEQEVPQPLGRPQILQWPLRLLQSLHLQSLASKHPRPHHYPLQPRMRYGLTRHLHTLRAAGKHVPRRHQQTRLLGCRQVLRRSLRQSEQQLPPPRGGPHILRWPPRPLLRPPAQTLGCSLVSHLRNTRRDVRRCADDT